MLEWTHNKKNRTQMRLAEENNTNHPDVKIKSNKSENILNLIDVISSFKKR